MMGYESLIQPVNRYGFLLLGIRERKSNTMNYILRKLCIYCKTPDPSQRYDYAGNAAGIMCDKCWATSALNQTKVPRIVIDVTGGIVQSVWSDTPVRVRIIDGDEDPPDPQRVINIAAGQDKPEFRYIWGNLAYGTQDVEIIERIFSRTVGLFER